MFEKRRHVLRCSAGAGARRLGTGASPQTIAQPSTARFPNTIAGRAAWRGHPLRARIPIDNAGAGFEEIGDVVTGERAVFEGVVECARGGIGTVDLTERDDFAHMMDGVEAAVREFAVILVGAGGERDEALEQALGGGLATLFEQGAGMVGVLEVAVSLVASRVAGEETVVVVDAQPVGVALQGQAL